MYGKIERKELLSFIDDKEFKDNAQAYFGDHQPHIWQTGYYSAPGWNWAYQVGITCINDYFDDRSVSGRQYFEVVTQFGEVKAARKINLPAYN